MLFVCVFGSMLTVESEWIRYFPLHGFDYWCVLGLDCGLVFLCAVIFIRGFGVTTSCRSLCDHIMFVPLSLSRRGPLMFVCVCVWVLQEAGSPLEPRGRRSQEPPDQERRAAQCVPPTRGGSVQAVQRRSVQRTLPRHAVSISHLIVAHITAIYLTPPTAL